VSLLSVLTPVCADRFEFLAQTYASLAAQRMPPGWAWEWVLQVDALDADGSGTDPPVDLADPRVRVGHGPRGGPSVARNLGLARASGTLVRNLDGDDVLLPGALARDVLALAGDQTLAWVTSVALDLGAGDAAPAHPPAGRLLRGSVRQSVVERGGALPVHPTTLCARREVLLALGGWTALPSGGDTALLLALDAVSDGCFLDQPSVRYRKHPNQVTARPEHTRPDLLAARRQLTLDRARALSELGWRFR
jgi:glycosyltransferase involved in cell wall biosynthesis